MRGAPRQKDFQRHRNASLHPKTVDLKLLPSEAKRCNQAISLIEGILSVIAIFRQLTPSAIKAQRRRLPP